MEDIYLKELEIINFRTHAHTVIPFKKGVNAFIGTSGSGKSNIIRALLFNILNEPSGTDFIMRKDGVNEAAVLTTWSNGYTIERRKNRTGTKNVYIIYKDGEVVNEYTGFGTKVPPEVIEVHGIQPLPSGVFFNYADQLESAFMISGTPRSRAETIGNLEELGKIDEGLTKINEDIRDDRKIQKLINEEIGVKEKEVDELENALHLKKNKIETLRMLTETIVEQKEADRILTRSLERLEEINKELKEHTVEVEKANRILEHWDEGLEDKITLFHSLQKSLKRLLEIQEELSSIKHMDDFTLSRLEDLTKTTEQSVVVFQALNRASKRMNEIEEEKKRAKNYSEKVAGLDFSTLDKEVEKYKFLLSRMKRSDEIHTELENREKEIKGATERIEQLLGEFVEALHDEKICPTCSQSTDGLSKEDVEKII